MVEDTAQQVESKTPGITHGQGPMATCPMATMCKGMMEKPPSGYPVMFAAAVLILLGVLIFVEPRIVVWLVGSAFVLFGIALFMMAKFLRRLGTQMRNT